MASDNEIKNGMIFNTKNYGKVVVLDYSSYYNVTIKFIDTGTIVSVRCDSIRDGSVVDYNFPKSYGIGFRGYGAFATNSKAYSAWYNMLSRCYSDDYHKRYPSYKGCSVCDEWHNFQNFAEWFYSNLNGKSLDDRLEVDKDIYGCGKIYSPSNCLIVTSKENTKESSNRNYAKEYALKNPQGEVVNIRNMSNFCKENNLDKSGMFKVVYGKYKQFKGWTLP